MSSDKPKPIYRTELDLAEDEFFAEFEEKDKELQWGRFEMYSREGNDLVGIEC